MLRVNGINENPLGICRLFLHEGLILVNKYFLGILVRIAWNTFRLFVFIT
jgi:hypothetical protein